MWSFQKGPFGRVVWDSGARWSSPEVARFASRRPAVIPGALTGRARLATGSASLGRQPGVDHSPGGCLARPGRHYRQKRAGRDPRSRHTGRAAALPGRPWPFFIGFHPSRQLPRTLPRCSVSFTHSRPVSEAPTQNPSSAGMSAPGTALAPPVAWAQASARRRAACTGTRPPSRARRDTPAMARRAARACPPLPPVGRGQDRGAGPRPGLRPARHAPAARGVRARVRSRPPPLPRLPG